MARIYFETHGCQMNEADSRYLSERAAASGYLVVDHPEDANVFVLNTCTVRDNAERRAYGRLSHFKSLKDADPTRRLVVCGCLAEQDRASMQKRLPYLDGIFGTRELRVMGDQLAAWAPDYDEEEAVSDRALLASIGGTPDGVVNAFTHLRAYVNVQRGCSYYCTYCIVPQVRGRFDHRPLEEILAEVRARLTEGAREITLVGQTVNAYIEPTTKLDFAGLLRVIGDEPRVERIGFITSHPKDLSDALIDALATIPKLNNRLHLAMQSGSNPILRRMNRKYTIEQFLDRVERFRAVCPDWVVTTDVIVGFPGETDLDFTRTMDVVAQSLFAQVYTFIYSPRRGTPAARWEPVADAVGNARLRALMELENGVIARFHATKIGSVVRALAQGPSRKDATKLALKTSDNVTIITESVGDVERFAATPWVDVRIESAHVWGCNGTIVGVARHVDGPSLPLLAHQPAAPEMPPRAIDIGRVLHNVATV